MSFEHGAIEEPAVESSAEATHAAAGPAQRTFAAELSGAMHAAANAWHARLKAEADRSRSSHEATVLQRAEAEAAELQAGIASDLADVEEAAKVAIRRVREERARKIGAIHAVLEERLVLHRSVIAREIEVTDATTGDYVNYLDGFFARLSAESDPAAIVRLAGSIPPPPDLEAASAAVRAEAEAEIAREIAAAEPTGPVAGPEELVPVMDPAAARSTPADGSWLPEATTPAEPADDDGADVTAEPEAQVATRSPEPLATGAGGSRSAATMLRLAGFFGRGESRAAGSEEG